MKIIRHPLFMRPHPDAELEQFIDRELRQLPDRPAPETLMPRVLRAIAAQKALPWWKRSFAFWPVPARLGFSVVSLSIAGLLTYCIWGISVGASLGALAGGIQGRLPELSLIWSLSESLISAGTQVLRATQPWVIWALAGAAAVCYLTTVGLGTLCWRLVAHRE